MQSNISAQPWDQIKQALKAQLTTRDYATWIAPLVVSKGEGRTLGVVMPNTIFYQKIHDDFLGIIERTKAELGLEGFSLEFILEGMPEVSESDYSDDLLDGQQNLTAEDATQNLASPSGFSRSLARGTNPNPGYTFQNFVKGPSNQFAMTTAQAVASKPGQFYNPLFLCGGTGLGKTHLLHSVANEVLKNNPNTIVTYTTSE